MKSKTELKYKTYYKKLREALELYADDHNLKGFKYQDLDGNYIHSAIASEIIDFCNKTFEYEQSSNARIEHFLQGLGLSVPFHNFEIFQMAYADNLLKENDSDDKHHNILDRYWRELRAAVKIISNQ